MPINQQNHLLLHIHNRNYDVSIISNSNSIFSARLAAVLAPSLQAPISIHIRSIVVLQVILFFCTWSELQIFTNHSSVTSIRMARREWEQKKSTLTNTYSQTIRRCSRKEYLAGAGFFLLFISNMLRSIFSTKWRWINLHGIRDLDGLWMGQSKNVTILFCCRWWCCRCCCCCCIVTILRMKTKTCYCNKVVSVVRTN